MEFKMNNVLKKYLSEATKFASDRGDEEAVTIATEGKKEDADKKVVAALSKNNLTKFPNKPGMFKKKNAIKEEEIEDIADSDELEEEEDITIDEEETEDDESYNEDSMNEEDDENIDADKLEEDEDDGAEDGEICEEDESCEEDDGEMADDDQIEDPKKKKMDIKESYIANASRWM